MEKPIRNAVRCFLIKDDQVVCIKYLEGRIGYYDVPGGKIEENETALQAVKREFIEETGVEVVNPIERGIMYLRYPDKEFIFKTFIASEYVGEFGKFKEIAKNTVELKKIEEFILEEKKFANIVLLEDFFRKILLDLSKTFEISVMVDDEENITKMNFKVFDV